MTNQNKEPFIRSNLPKKYLTVFGIILLGLAILSVLHFHNGFPLILRDSIGYINRAHYLKESSHWSNTYVVFIALIYKVFGTLQMVAVFQNLMVVSVLYIYTNHFLKPFTYLKFISVITALVFTTLPWISTMMMSDIFTPMSLLIVYLMLERNLTKLEMIILVPILFLGMSAHQSHLVIVPIFGISLILYKIFLRKENNKKQLFLYSILVGLIFLMSHLFEKQILNSIGNKKVRINKNYDPNSKTSDISSGYYFLAIRMHESGQLDKLLEGFCNSTNSNYLCSDEITPDGEIRVKTVNYHLRNDYDKEYRKYSRDNKEFVMHCLTQPRFYYGCALIVVKRGFTLMTNPNIQNYINPRHVETKEDLFTRDFKKSYPKDIDYYKESKQFRQLYPRLISKTSPKINIFWWKIILPIALLFSLFSFYNFRKWRPDQIDCFHAIFFILFAHILNTMICGTFSNHENLRYSSRTLWMINLAMMILFNQINQSRKEK